MCARRSWPQRRSRGAFDFAANGRFADGAASRPSEVVGLGSDLKILRNPRKRVLRMFELCVCHRPLSIWLKSGKPGRDDRKLCPSRASHAQKKC